MDRGEGVRRSIRRRERNEIRRLVLSGGRVEEGI